jgi:hypothetical protein
MRLAILRNSSHRLPTPTKAFMGRKFSKKAGLETGDIIGVAIVGGFMATLLGVWGDAYLKMRAEQKSNQ